MIRVTSEMLPDVRAYLERHAEFVMFPLTNLATYGLDGTAPRAPQFWVNEGPLQDVLCMTTEGMVMPFLPSGDVSAAAQIVRASGAVIGMIGPAASVRPLQSALGLAHAPATMNEDEPQFMLALDDLIIPEGEGALIPLADAPEDLIRDWMADYQRNALHTTEPKITDLVEMDYRNRCATGSHMVLVIDGVCVAKTGFNAQLPDIVQIGGVYTSPCLRGRGYARRAVALHLAQARAAGVTRATLFSASDMAARAYMAIGFERIGDWTLMLFDGHQHSEGRGA